jgi:mono/diheme cytochrome c family protein
MNLLNGSALLRLARSGASFGAAVLGVAAASRTDVANDDFKNPYAWVMKAMVENGTDADLKAVAAYLSSMP